MGRATIISGGDDGRYTIEVDTGGDQQQAKIDALNARIASLTADLATANVALSDAQAAVEAQQSVVAQAVDAYVLATQASDNPADWQPALQAHKDAMAVLMLMQGEAATLRTRRDMLALELSQAQRELTQWDSLPIVTQRQAWCVDLTENGSGQVATAEIDGEQDLILIQAGCRPPVGGDGVLLARWVQSPEQAYSNAAILPGWQKWKPTYRTGTITALDTDADTADVALDAATSSAQSLDINQAPTSLSAVPVVYMTCNAEAFEEGDRCVVEFQGQAWASPRVIGFVDNPRPCIFWPELLYAPISYEVETLPRAGSTTRIEVYDYTSTPCMPSNTYPISFDTRETAIPNRKSFNLESLRAQGWGSGVPTGFSASGLTPRELWGEVSNFFVNYLTGTGKETPPSGSELGECFTVLTPPSVDSIGIKKITKSFADQSFTRYIQTGTDDFGAPICEPQTPFDAFVVDPDYSVSDEYPPTSYGDFVAANGGRPESVTLTHESGPARTYEYIGSEWSNSPGPGRLIYQLVEP